MVELFNFGKKVGLVQLSTELIAPRQRSVGTGVKGDFFYSFFESNHPVYAVSYMDRIFSLRIDQEFLLVRGMIP